MSWIAAMEAVHKLLVEASMRKEMWTRPQKKIRRRKTGLESNAPSKRIAESSRLDSGNLVNQGFRKEKWQTESKLETEVDGVKKIERRQEQTVQLIELSEENINESAKIKTKTRPTRTVVRGIRKVHKDMGVVKESVLETTNESKARRDKPMEVEADGRKLDKESLQRFKLKVKDWWRRPLWKKLDKWKKPW